MPKRRFGGVLNFALVLGMAAILSACSHAQVATNPPAAEAAATSTSAPLPVIAEAAPANDAGKSQHRLLDEIRKGRARSQSRPAPAAGGEMHRREIEGGAALNALLGPTNRLLSAA